MELLKKLKKDTVATCVIEIALGLLLAVFPDILPTVTAYIIGVLLIAYGVNDIIKGSKSGQGITGGVIMTVIGVLCVIFAKSLIINIISFVFGAFFIIKGAISLASGAENVKVSRFDGVLEIIFAAITLIFGVVLILVPSNGKIFFVLCGVFLIVNGITDLIDILAISEKVKNAVKRDEIPNVYEVDFIEVKDDEANDNN